MNRTKKCLCPFLGVFKLKKRGYFTINRLLYVWSSQQKKYRSWLQGHFAEVYASLYLRLRSYVVLHRRFKSPVGEIDIIARSGSTLVFLEVKYRKTHQQGLEAITAQQQRRIIRAAHYYLARGVVLDKIRFDVLSVSRYYRIKHIKNAFIYDS